MFAAILREGQMRQISEIENVPRYWEHPSDFEDGIGVCVRCVLVEGADRVRSFLRGFGGSFH